MYNDLILENADGDQLRIGADPPFQLSDISGLNPPSATINTSELALLDGAQYNSSKMNMRQILIAFAVCSPAEQNRLAIYKVLRSKQYVKLIYRSDTRDVYAEGYVQSAAITMMAMKQVCTVTILCPSPYLMGAQEIVNELTSIAKKFHFPFHSEATPEIVFGTLQTNTGVTITNDGDLECGMVIELYAKAGLTDPTIYNYISQESFGLIWSMQTADLITIDTRPGRKSVKLLRGGMETNLVNYIKQGSEWLQLPPNGGTFVYTVGTGSVNNLTVTFRHVPLFEGV